MADEGFSAWFSKKKQYTIESFLTPNQALFCCGVAVASFAAGFQCSRLGVALRRYTSGHAIPQSIIDDGNHWLRGRVVSVSDGDTFRLRHAPSILHSSRLPPDEKLSTSTIPVRICTIDTPETAKFGKPGQLFGEEAKQYLTDLILDKTVKIRPLHRDQYGRVVAEVYRWPNIYPDVRLLKMGLAEVYQGSGAVHGRLGKEAYAALQKAAQQKKGIWSLQGKRESASAYKARMKSGTT